MRRRNHNIFLWGPWLKPRVVGLLNVSIAVDEFVGKRIDRNIRANACNIYLKPNASLQRSFSHYASCSEMVHQELRMKARRPF
jgi:hypothetical protein